MIFLSPTEHDLQKLIPKPTYRISSLCESNGADIIVPTRKGFIAYQRKTLPDLSSSLKDGRLYRELAQLRSSQTIYQSILILEYNPQEITIEGQFLNVDLTKQSLWAILAKVQLTGTYCLHSRNITDTIELFTSVSKYLAKNNSEAIRRINRPSSGWGNINNRDYQIYLLQSFPAIGPTTATAIIDFFGTVPIKWTVTAQQLQQVSGIGKKTAERLISILGSIHEKD